MRKDGEPIAHRHITDEATPNYAFCGQPVPDVVWADPRSWLNKGPVTCSYCLSEFNNGRTGGFRTAEEAAQAAEGS